MDAMTAMSGPAAFALGARLAGLGVVTVGAQGGGLGWMLARCVGCGAAMAGADVLFHDGTTPAAGAWLARHYELPAAAYFLVERGQAEVFLHDGQGRALEEGQLPRSSGRVGPVGTWDQLVGTDGSYASHRVAGRRVDGLVVTVMPGPGQAPLITALERLGCEVLPRPCQGVPLLRCDRAGLRLTVRDGLSSRSPAGADALSAAVGWCLERVRGSRPVPAFGTGEDIRLV